MMGRRANVASVSALNGAIVGRDAAATGRRGRSTRRRARSALGAEIDCNSRKWGRVVREARVLKNAPVERASGTACFAPLMQG